MELCATKLVDTLDKYKLKKVRTRDPKLWGPALFCLSVIDKKNRLIFSKHNSVLVFLMGHNPKCSGYNQRLFISKMSDLIKERTKETS